MRNSTIDVITVNIQKLDAMLSMLSSSVDNAAFERLSADDRGNYVWVMSDLVQGIRAAISAEAEVNHV